MKTITIREPIWFNRSIGVADNKLTGDFVKVRISYKTKDGNRLYPEDFIISTKKLKEYYLTSPKGKRPALRMIPIEDLERIAKELV